MQAVRLRRITFSDTQAHGTFNVNMRVLLSTFAFLALIFTGVQSDTTGRVVCYYSSWAVYRPDVGSYAIEEIPASLCTHVIYAYVGITYSSNKILVFDYDMEIENTGFKNFTSLSSQYPNVKFMVGIGGWGDGGATYSHMVSNPGTRANFTKSVTYFMNDFGFQGIDLDWEYPGAPDRNGTAADKDNFLTLVQELRAAFDAEGKDWELTVSMPLFEDRLTTGFHVPELCQILDAVYVNAYDLRAYYDGFVDVQAPLYGRPDDPPGYEKLNLDSGLKLLETMGCPANKLVVGIPFYGRTFILNDHTASYDVGTKINITAGGGDAGKYTTEIGALAYYEICTLINGDDSDWTIEWAEYGMCPYAYKGTEWIGYEDKESMEAKMKWIKERGYQGAMIWSIDMDDFQGLCGEKYPLLSVVHEEMSTYTVPTPSE